MWFSDATNVLSLNIKAGIAERTVSVDGSNRSVHFRRICLDEFI